MKKCPKCNKVYEEDEFVGCPKCGTNLISYNPSESDSRHSPKEGDDNGDAFVFWGERPINDHPHNHTIITKLREGHLSDNQAKDNRSASVGDNNTFTGGVHDDHSSTNSGNKENSDNVTQTNSNNTTTTTNTTNNTTIYEAKKSESDLLKENLQAYRLECKMRYKNGLISKDDQDYLREIQREYGLADEIVAPVKEEIQQLSRERTTKLTLTVISGIGKTKSIIEQNSSNAIQSHLMQLESWMREYDDDSLESWYYQLSSILKPVPYTESYEQSTKDEFWQVYWAYIAYMLQNKAQQAYDARAFLGRFETSYSEPNDEVLGLAGRMILNEPIEDIKKDYKAGTIHCTKELQLLLETIDELLQKKWSRETEVRPVHSFYANILFKSFVDTQIEVGKKQREEEERISRAEREHQEEVNRQKGYLLQKFQEVEDIEKACDELGIPYLTFQNWQEEDFTFNSRYNAIVRHIEDKRNEDAERIRSAKEKEAEVKRQKSHFKFLYEQNNCDLIKTCTETGVDSDTISCWRESDRAFDDALSFIEREYAKKLQDIFLQCYEANNCDVQKACAEMEIGTEVVNNWRNTNNAFDEALSSIENEYIQGQKEAFAKCYKQNDCNLQKTCSELGLYSGAVEQWRHDDSSFDEYLKLIEKLHAKLVRKARLRKILPWLSIVALSIACVFGIMKVSRDYNEGKEKNEIEGQYDLAVSNFNTAFSHIDTSDEGLDALSNAAIALKQVIGLEHSPYLEGKEESLSLKRKFDVRVEELLENFQNKASLVPEKGGNEIVWKDGEKGQKRVKEIINTLQQ